MVKKGALIGAILATIGGVIFALYLISAYGRDDHGYMMSLGEPLTFIGLLFYTSFDRFSDNPLITIILLMYVIGSIVNYFSTFSSKKVLLIIGSIITSVGLFGIYLNWFMTRTNASPNNQIVRQIEVYGGLYLGMSILYSIGTIIYYIGLITYRKYFKAGVITGGIILALVLFTNLFYGAIFLPSRMSDEISAGDFTYFSRNINFHLMLQIIQVIVLLIHFWMSAFVNKVVYDYEEDELSVEGGAAFTSYVEPKAKKDKGKKKKSKKSEDVEFTF